MKIALKVAYNGQAFHGSQRQPGQRTVEGDFIKAITEIENNKPLPQFHFQAASRTDTGVSALGNVFCMDIDMSPSGFINALNSRLNDAWVCAYAEVGQDFNPRFAESREYRYYLPKDLLGNTDLTTGPHKYSHVVDGMYKIQSVLDLFTGQHDFTNFCRLEAGRNPIRCIECFNSFDEGAFIVFKIAAQSFLWHMVRKIIGAVVMYSNEEVSLEDLKRGLDRDIDFNPKMAPARYLVLWDVAYPGLDFRRVNIIKKTGCQIRDAISRAEYSSLFFRELKMRFSADNETNWSGLGGSGR